MANYLLTQTGEEVQDILNQAPETEEGLQQEVTNREQAITAEQQAREQAIAAEATARADADDALDTKIDAETTRAEGAEGTLNDAIAQEVTDRTAAVSAEATARQQADTAQQQALAQETSRAQQAELANAQAISTNAQALQAEANTRQNADTVLQDHIDDEETRAKAAEATLQANIDTLGQSGGAAVAAERERAEAAESTLDGKIDAETDRAEAAEGTLNAAIAQEVTDRTAAVSAEATARQQADTALQTAINGKQDTIADLADIRSGAAAGATAYQKPATGIPATDMSAGVQTSLGKADSALQEHQSLADYYTKSEVDNLITTPDQEYVSVTATAQTTAVTDLLPATGAADTIYRVGNWDGTQYDPTMYALFAWNGTTYVCLAVRSFVGEVYDISVNHPDGQGNPTPYADLTAALGTDGANIPVDIRRGGMRIQFIQGNAQSSDNKYVRYNLLADSFTTDTTQWAIDDGGVYMDNPEYVYVKTDKDGKILWAIKIDGGIYYGAGVPPQVVEYIQQKINQYHGDDILTFLNGLEEGDKTLQDLLNERGEYIENPEYIQAISDSKNRVLEGIKTDGTKVFHGKVEILGSTNIQGVEYSLIQSPEWIRVVTDSHGNILCGIRIDGNIYINSLVEIPSVIQDAINSSIVKRMEPLVKKISAIESIFLIVDNPEYIAVEADKEGNVLSGRNINGSKFENLPVKFNNKVSIDGNDIENIQDIEGRTELKTDNKGNVISYRDGRGVLHEVAGIEPEHLYLPKDSLEQSYQYNKNHADYKNWYLPKFGKVNIKSEKFYLTADGWSDYSEDVILIQILDNTNAVARQLIPIAHFYIKSTLVELPGGGYDRTSVTEDSVKLDLYVPKDIQEVSGLYYVKKTLTKVTDPITGDVTYEVNTNSIEVRQVTDVPPYMAWKVDKKPEHWCIADIDFGELYSKNNVAVGIKYQGRSTLALAKRGFRLTFYKNVTYAKKDKVKIGEMIRLSGYNMKAYANDYSLIKDPVISAIVIEMWKTLGDNCFPWDNASVPFNGATGTIKSFPIETWFADTFYGLQFFGYKKDEKNYLLDGDDDSSGVFAQGAADLGVNMNDPNPSMFNDEMGVDGRELAYPDNEDSVSVETAAAMENLFNRIKCLVNGSVVVGGETIEFSKEYFEECVDLKSWIDYWIVCEVFLLWDNLNNNIILYSGRDKMMYYTFFYDLDQSMNFPYNTNMVDRFNLGNGFWDKFRNEYKDFIINRYYELRKTVLSLNNINSIYKSIIRGIPESVNTMEFSIYGNSIHKFDSYMEFLENRLSYLDNNYLNF